MADEKQAEQGKSSLASRLNAAPFIPGGKGGRGGGTSNVNAKPFTPGAGKAGGSTLGSDAKAFVPQQNGDLSLFHLSTSCRRVPRPQF